jgi:hypothetical protein
VGIGESEGRGKHNGIDTLAYTLRRAKEISKHGYFSDGPIGDLVP